MITKNRLKQWTTKTLREALTASPVSEPIKWRFEAGINEKKAFINHLYRLRKSGSDFGFAVLDAPMTGHLSQGWRDLDRDDIHFQGCLAAVQTAYPGAWTPADYLLQCYLTAKTKNVDLEDMDLGRALRNLPSFMREDLIADILSNREGIAIEIPSADMNAQYHVDIILQSGGTQTYIWSYLSSPHAIKKLTQSKLNGNRGKILTGQNLLAPFDRKKDAEDFHGWWVPTETYADRLLDALKGPVLSYSEVLALLRQDPQRSFSKNILFRK